MRTGRFKLFVVFFWCVAGTGVYSQPGRTRLLFTGDILLSRRVISELQQRKISPWARFTNLFHEAQWVSGNLEGAVGPECDCQKRRELCLNIPESAVALLKSGGFTAVTLENNHAGDLGVAGRERTRDAIEKASLTAVDFESSPRTVQIGGRKVALVAITLIPAADKRVQSIPSAEVSAKLLQARKEAQFVVVSIHWGTEYQRRPDAVQRDQARWLIEQGADLIVGHHPHVVQAPECIEGHPVFFSLGNHLFDQTYPPTKEGLIADCEILGERLHCEGFATHTEAWTTIPHPGGVDPSTHAALAACTPRLEESR